METKERSFGVCWFVLKGDQKEAAKQTGLASQLGNIQHHILGRLRLRVKVVVRDLNGLVLRRESKEILGMNRDPCKGNYKGRFIEVSPHSLLRTSQKQETP